MTVTMMHPLTGHRLSRSERHREYQKQRARELIQKLTWNFKKAVCVADNDGIAVQMERLAPEYKLKAVRIGSQVTFIKLTRTAE